MEIFVKCRYSKDIKESAFKINQFQKRDYSSDVRKRKGARIVHGAFNRQFHEDGVVGEPALLAVETP